MILSSESIIINSTCGLTLLWSQTSIDSRRPLLYTCIIASIIHTVFWLQVILSPSLRQKTMQWLYVYLTTDILLLIRFFYTFIVHTAAKECVSNRIWLLSVCYCEAIVDNYLNILEGYILLALNLCRYVQISRNRNVYVMHVRLLIIAHLVIYLIPMIIFLIQLFVGWAQLQQYNNDSCTISYTNLYTQGINTIIAFILPISLNIPVIYASIRHVHLTSQLRRGQHHISARDKYHRSLVIQFFVFYTIWLLLWSPNVIIYQVTSGTSRATLIGSLLNYIEITLDPIIIGALDIRFYQVSKKNYRKFKNQCFKLFRINHQRIRPAAIDDQLQTTRQIVLNHHRYIH